MSQHNVVPRATYRLQFHEKFKFRDALALVPYLDSLGFSHIYASPFFLSAPGSVHGYDVCDHNQFDPEIGTAEDFRELSQELRKRGMSILLDFVPNHMGISSLLNRWWTDVLENGASSAYARYFDIDWKPPKRELENQVLLPILGDQYGRVLERGELQIIWNDGVYQLDYLGRRLPLSPASNLPLLERAIGSVDLPVSVEKSVLLEEMNRVFGVTGSTSPQDREEFRGRLSKLAKKGSALHGAILAGLQKLHARFDELDAVLSLQHYRLSYWKVATEEINYRRFFDVNTLAALRMEEPGVFEDAHRLLLQLISDGAVGGVRIDHIDGLAFPKLYLDKLQEAMRQAGGGSRTWLLVEKILAVNEDLPADWNVDGTTGYEFAAETTGLQIDPAAEKILTTGYARLTEKRTQFRDEVYLGKKLVMQVAMAAEVNSLGSLLNRISEGNRWYRDFTINALTTAVRELIACFPVYRSYLEPGQPISDIDRRLVLKAIALALRRNPGLERSVFEFLRDVLLPPVDNPHPVDEELRAKFVLKFQQNTGPVTAKGVEDTAFYVYSRFAALNEVGSDPGKFGTTVEEFHASNLKRQQRYPFCLLGTSTHDTKRSEDVRARITVLSELPREWLRLVRKWRILNQRHRVEIDGDFAPDANEEFLLYQILLGSWPLGENEPDYLERIQEYMVKALHEAKVNSGWIDPNEQWDQAVKTFVTRILSTDSRNRFRMDMEGLVKKTAYRGMINSLSQTVLKLTAPGVPDFYQGTEIWDWSLVDPDNRRAVKYGKRQALLKSLDEEFTTAELLQSWPDGRIRLYVVTKLLNFRKLQPDLFAEGDYVPVQVDGRAAENFGVFLRKKTKRTLLVVVPRFAPERSGWDDITIDGLEMPNGYNLLTGNKPDSFRLGDLLETLPFAVIYSEGASNTAL